MNKQKNPANRVIATVPKPWSSTVTKTTEVKTTTTTTTTKAEQVIKTLSTVGFE